jgi:hypothetical protein
VQFPVSSRQVISVDPNSRGEERLGRAVLLIAEGVRINAYDLHGRDRLALL